MSDVHTPGPWAAEGRGINISIVFAGDVPGNRPGVCLLADGTQEEREANARLVAAAPDLLEACEFALELPGLIAEYRSQPENTTGAGSEIDTVLAAINAAIAKARTPSAAAKRE